MKKKHLILHAYEMFFIKKNLYQRETVLYDGERYYRNVSYININTYQCLYYIIYLYKGLYKKNIPIFTLKLAVFRIDYSYEKKISFFMLMKCSLLKKVIVI